MPSGSLLGINISAIPGVASPAAITKADYNLRRGKAAGYLFISRGDRGPISMDQLIAALPGPAVRVTVEGPEDRLRLADALARLMSTADNHVR